MIPTKLYAGLTVNEQSWTSSYIQTLSQLQQQPQQVWNNNFYPTEAILARAMPQVTNMRVSANPTGLAYGLGNSFVYRQQSQTRALPENRLQDNRRSTEAQWAIGGKEGGAANKPTGVKKKRPLDEPKPLDARLWLSQHLGEERALKVLNAPSGGSLTRIIEQGDDSFLRNLDNLIERFGAQQATRILRPVGAVSLLAVLYDRLTDHPDKQYIDALIDVFGTKNSTDILAKGGSGQVIRALFDHEQTENQSRLMVLIDRFGVVGTKKILAHIGANQVLRKLIEPNAQGGLKLDYLISVIGLSQTNKVLAQPGAHPLLKNLFSEAGQGNSLLQALVNAIGVKKTVQLICGRKGHKSIDALSALITMPNSA